MYNLSSAKLLLYWLTTSESLGIGPGLSTCTVLYNTLNMHLVASIIGCQFRELIGCLTFSGAPGSNVDNSLGGAYLGLFSTPLLFEVNPIPQHRDNTPFYVVLMALSKAQLKHVLIHKHYKTSQK